MITRRATAEVYYNGKNIKTTLDDYATSFEYSDPDHGESDSISVTIADPSAQWISAWLPSKGDEISAVITFQNRDKEEALRQALNCGKFIIDDLSFSAGTQGSQFQIAGVSAPADSAFQARARTQTWEGVTIKKIAETISKRHNLALVFDADDIPIATQEQSDTDDCSFLTTLCEEYGLFTKVFAKKLVIFDREKKKKEDPVATISKEDMISFSWQTTIAGTYTGGEMTYSEPFGCEDISVTTGTGKRRLKLNEKADSQADAKRRLNAAVATANHSMTGARFSVMGMTNIVSGQNVLITGFGKLSGKYYIDRKTDRLSGSGYTSDIEASLVEAAEEAVLLDALKRMYARGIINDPAYWQKHAKSVPYLTELIVNIATVCKNTVETYAGELIEVDEAIAKLATAGVINTTDYWQKHKTDLPYIAALLVNAAKAI